MLALLFAWGVALRVAACLAWWPTIPTFADAWPYAYFAKVSPFGDPQHPAGYSVFLWVIGLFSHQVAVVTILTHLIGLWTAGLVYAAARRVTGSPWPGLLGAAFVLLNADQVYQEQLVASEPLSAFFLGASLYATVRAWDSRNHRIHWCLATGALVAACTIVRTEAILLAPILSLALLLVWGRPVRTSWNGVIALLAVWGILLVGYGFTKEAVTGSFQVGPSTGWQLYASAAPFANCSKFTPPPGTRGLCETTPPSKREGNGHYLYDLTSPAVRLFRHIGNQDGKVGAWAKAAIVSDPGAFADDFYHTLRSYFIPSDFHYVPGAGGDNDSELNWLTPADPTSVSTIKGMETFFDPFTPHRRPLRVEWLYRYQRAFRFGATAMTLCALLSALGLGIGSRRTRAAILAFGVGSLALLIPESLLDAYLGRYTVPIAGPMGAAAGLALWSLAGAERARRSGGATELS